MGINDFGLHAVFMLLLHVLATSDTDPSSASVLAAIPMAVSACCCIFLIWESKKNNKRERIQYMLGNLISTCASVGDDAESVKALSLLPTLDLFTLHKAHSILARELSGEVSGGVLMRISSKEPCTGSKGKKRPGAIVEV